MNKAFPAWIRLFLILLLIFNFLKSIDYYKHPDYPYDARNVHIAGKLWLQKKNPYDDAEIKHYWKQCTHNNHSKSLKEPGFPDCGMIYPFFSIPFLLPYYFLSWTFNKYFIWALSIILILTFGYLSRTFVMQKKVSLFLAMLSILAFKSSMVAVALGQPVLLSLVFLTLSYTYYQKSKELLCGLFLGLAMLKISICIPFIAWYFFNRKWKLLTVSVVVVLLSSIAFGLVSGSFYWNEMIQNISTQMSFNYPGTKLNAVNSNLTELSILANYYGEVSHSVLSRFNVVLLLAGYLGLGYLYLKRKINSVFVLPLLILWQFLFSYHLIYDCLLLVFIFPALTLDPRKTSIYLLLLSPLYLPINGVFRNLAIMQFHLPLTLLCLFLFVFYESYTSGNKRLSS